MKIDFKYILLLLLPVLSFCCKKNPIWKSIAKSDTKKNPVSIPLEYKYRIKAMSSETIPTALFIPIRNNTAETLYLSAYSPDIPLMLTDNILAPHEANLKMVELNRKFKEGYNCIRVEYTVDSGRSKIPVNTLLHVNVEIIRQEELIRIS